MPALVSADPQEAARTRLIVRLADINLVPHLAEVLSRLSPEFAALAFQPGSEERFIEQCSHLRTYHTLPDGRLLPLPGKRIAPILKSLLELIGPRASGLVDGKVNVIPNHVDSEGDDEDMLVDEDEALDEIAPDSMDEDIYD